MNTNQQLNHNIQQALLKDWLNKHPDFYILKFDNLRNKINKMGFKSYLDIKSYILVCSIDQYSKNIFSNRYVLDITEKDIDGNGKRVKEDIEENFLKEYRNNQQYKAETLYNYFSLQLSRSESLLLNSYDSFCLLFNEIDDKISYNNFKKFYNSLLSPTFIKTINMFTKNKYKYLMFECDKMINKEGVEIDSFFWITESNAFELSKLNLKKQIKRFEGFQLNNIYACLVSPKNIIFVYHPMYSEEYIKQIATHFVNFWNNVALGIVSRHLIFPKSSIDTVSESMFDLLEYDNNYLNNNKILDMLINFSNSYEK